MRKFFAFISRFVEEWGDQRGPGTTPFWIRNALIPNSDVARRPRTHRQSAQKWRKRRRRRRRRRRRNNAFGLGLWHQWSSDWFSFTSPEISTWLLVPKSPLLSPASAAVFSFSSSTIPKPPHTGFCIWILIWTHLFRFCIAVAEGYWLKQSSISPYAGFYRNFKSISFKLFI